MGWMGVSGTGGRAFGSQLGQKEGVEAPIYLRRASGGGHKVLEGGPMRLTSVQIGQIMGLDRYLDYFVGLDRPRAGL